MLFHRYDILYILFSINVQRYCKSISLLDIVCKLPFKISSLQASIIMFKTLVLKEDDD